eukprot:1949253-Rhodomonas_salina.2
MHLISHLEKSCLFEVIHQRLCPLWYRSTIAVQQVSTAQSVLSLFREYCAIRTAFIRSVLRNQYCRTADQYSINTPHSVPPCNRSVRRSQYCIIYA